MVSIRYWGHACFELEYQDYHIVLDPYIDGMVPGLRPLRLSADAVYCSHQHEDHNFVQAVQLSGKPPAYLVDKFEVPHDGQGGAIRGMNTVHVFRFDDFCVVHLGDLGRLLTEEEVQRLGAVDCLLIPVGGFYTIDPKMAKCVVEQVRPRVVIPMHYRTRKSGFSQIALLDQFTEQFPAVKRCGDTAALDASTEKQVLVMQARNEGE